MRPFNRTSRAVLAWRYVTLWFITWLGSRFLTASALAITVSASGWDLIAEPGQELYGLNLDGVVRVQANRSTGCTAALITDRHLLTAAHCFSGGSDRQMQFDDSTALTSVFDLPGGAASMEFAMEDVILPSDWQEKGADVAVISLPDLAPEIAPRYPIYGRQDEIGKSIVMAGYGFSVLGSLGRVDGVGVYDEKLAGLNRYEAFGEDVLPSMAAGSGLVYDFDSGQEQNNTLAAMGVSSDLGFGNKEVKSSKGDSGGPVFIDGAIAGVVASNLEGYPSDLLPFVTDTWGEMGTDTRVSSFQAFIVEATDGQVVIVSEPGTGLLQLTAICVLLSWCRRPRRTSMKSRRPTRESNA